jgi:hypothetical protein
VLLFKYLIWITIYDSMAGGRRGARTGRGSEVRTLKLMNYVLLLVVAGLVIYIMYPTIASAFAVQPLGKTLAGINAPLSPSQLAVINGAPNSYFERAGEMMLNLSLPNEGLTNGIYYAQNFQIAFGKEYQLPQFTYNGKPSVIYIGATSCVWCGESRWAMAMALSRFGNFSSLYVGYSAIHDADVPTLYWRPQELHVNGTANFGNNYTSSYINFFSAEYDSNISAGFEFASSSNPISFFAVNAPGDGYQQAMQYMNSTGAFAGTPFTLWGTVLNRGASGVVIGTPQNSTVAQSGGLPLTYMTHSQILGQLNSFNSTFAIEEYAAADVYIAQLCPSINNAAPVCKLPAIQSFEQKMGLS